MTELFEELYRIILIRDASAKSQATHALATGWADLTQSPSSEVSQIPQPGYPPALKLVAPRQLKRRSIQSQQGRNTLLHAIAHIEFNAINLALDAAYRFRGQPVEYYRDWIKIADDEARHFELIRRYLNQHNCDYGDYSAHNGLWDMAVSTQHDVLARMALVPRVLEARGLDVTPGMIERLERVGDTAAADILRVIYEDEISHVQIGSYWFFYQCEIVAVEPRQTFLELVATHLHGELRGPFNVSARLQAGFDEIEMHHLTTHFDPTD